MTGASKRDTVSAYRARAAATERLIDEAVAEVKKAQAVEYEALRAFAALRAAPVPFTEEQYQAARIVRTKLGWFKVVRVNTQSVTVETGYSWKDRVARSKILEVE